ncbi:3-hydroxyisobutyrate dehydrogenase-like beta-hydroxyacid dehydrogenase [Rhodopseudomonas rhenobacensis]|uniref:3-hydroxyisobutyrate dehydrogenase-like beta-hydroxyacid dehydrogenase n=1 Tax=Rhodopseudomonas rhenobacensis TaxID=87461 RepID=A0A7W8DXX5_9BRAD|nr:NAD(P)-dependent oxidoreductase [Rhodopseudomonas rhenobacensis]MBB5046220.1 3-hydroxyisobutyrate dehydrogenase-like beta-hydroxyacid dehydrogenase [Rhodopseudomonas rhenobacensis]
MTNTPANSDAPASPQHPIRVGVVGLGRMGRAFAENLCADGYPVVAWDAAQAAIDAVAQPGITAARKLADLADCDVVLSSLPDDEALTSVTTGPGGLVETLQPGAVHISMSTISPAMSRRLAAWHAARRQGYVAAPVLGNPDLAKARTLFILAAGPAAAMEKAKPLLDRLGQKLFVIGEDAAAANLVKLAGNVLTALTLQSMGEVLALLRKSGIDPRVGFDIFTNSLFDARVHRTYGGKIVEERYSPPGMTVPLAVKDLRLALAVAESSSVPMPATSLVHDRLVAMVAHGWADLDWSALGLLAARDAGLPDLHPATAQAEKGATTRNFAAPVKPIDHVYPPSSSAPVNGRSSTLVA